MVQIVIDGILTSYKVLNPKADQTMLVLHGWGHDLSRWVGVVQELDRRFRYVLVDLPGFGGTSHLEGVADVPEYGKFVESFIRELEVEKCWILGHSFGGQIAVYLAVVKPSMISGLVLVSPAVVRLKSLRNKVKIFIFKRFGIIKRIVPRLWVEAVLRRVTDTDYYESSDQQREILKRITSFELVYKLNKVKALTLLLWGERDTAIAYKAKEVAEKIPDCRLKVLYGEGHNVHLSNNPLLVYEINAYLRRVK